MLVQINLKYQQLLYLQLCFQQFWYQKFIIDSFDISSYSMLILCYVAYYFCLIQLYSDNHNRIWMSEIQRDFL